MNDAIALDLLRAYDVARAATYGRAGWELALRLGVWLLILLFASRAMVREPPIQLPGRILKFTPRVRHDPGALFCTGSGDASESPRLDVILHAVARRSNVIICRCDSSRPSLSPGRCPSESELLSRSSVRSTAVDRCQHAMAGSL